MGMIARGLAAEGCDVTSTKREPHYSAHIADRSRPFPGLIDTLDELTANGHSLAVCTNKLERLSVQLLKTLALADCFDAICDRILSVFGNRIRKSFGAR